MYSGKGIDKENLKTLFERYSRFDKSVGGFGIGLNIVSLIAKRVQFKIDVKSQIDIGTKVESKMVKSFYVCLLSIFYLLMKKNIYESNCVRCHDKLPVSIDK